MLEGLESVVALVAVCGRFPRFSGSLYWMSSLQFLLG